MTCVITRQVGPTPQPQLAISDDGFAAAVVAKRSLFVVLGIEEKFAMLAENYREFEEDLMKQSLRSSVYAEFGYQVGQDRLYASVRRLMNVLSAVRSYTDQIKHDISGLGDSTLSESVDALFAREYDARLGFRVMEALRNFAQHRSVPIHSLKLQLDHVAAAVPAGRVSTVPFIRLVDLDANGGFKRSVLNELTALGRPEVDARPLLRAYIAGLANVHADIRKLLAERVSEWESIIHALIERWKSETDQDFGGLVIVRREGEDEIVEQIFDEFITRRQRLVHLVSRVGSAERVFVSNEERRDAETASAASADEL